MIEIRSLPRYLLPFVLLVAVGPAFGQGEPTCSDVLDIEVHGHHVVADYVMGTGHVTTGWPPAGEVGQEIRGDGAALPGGPGPGFHFEVGFAPGASFCNPRSRSPGVHAPLAPAP